MLSSDNNANGRFINKNWFIDLILMNKYSFHSLVLHRHRTKYNDKKKYDRMNKTK